MDALQHWTFAWEYSILNATVPALHFWMEDLKPHVLSHTIDQVCKAFFYGNHTQQVQNLPEEILFGHFVTTLNDAFEVELAQEDECYESGSENFCNPTPLCRTLRVYHVSMVDDFTFNLMNFGQSPAPLEQLAEPSSHRHRSHNPTHFCLVFTSSTDERPIRSSEWHSTPSTTNARSPTPRDADVSSLVHHITPTMDHS